MGNFINKILENRLFKDSFWAVFGNGLGYGLLLLSGIVIARILGRDVYGEYGMVKNTMFFMASFASFGLQYTSTKFIAEYLQKDKSCVVGIAKDSLSISIVTSSIMCCVLILFAPEISQFINSPELTNPLRFLGCLIIFRGIISCQTGILSGFGDFKNIARGNVFGGSVMIIFCVPLTYYFALYGALIALTLSQISNMILFGYALNRNYSKLFLQNGIKIKKELLLFSLPVAMQESSYTICNWGGTLLLVKLSSTGELGLYSAAAQWNAVIMFVPMILRNVVLSHLSGHHENRAYHDNVLKRMIFVNLLCTVPCFIVICILSRWISSFYGPSFEPLSLVLKVVVFSSIFSCMSAVLYSDLLSENKNWSVGIARLVNDVTGISLAYLMISSHQGSNAAFYYGLSMVITSIVYFSFLFVVYIRSRKLRC